MVGQPFDVFGQAVRVSPLHRLGNRHVQRSAVLKEARVGHLVRQCVFERVLEIREQARLIEKFRLLQVGQPPPQRLVGYPRDRRQDRVGYVSNENLRVACYRSSN